MTLIRSTIRILIPLNKQSEALEILGSVCDQTQFEPHCVTCRLYRGVDDGRAILVETFWTSEEEMRRHLQSQAYHRVLLVIEMAEEPPEIRFDTIAHTSGVETIEEARNR